MLTFEQIKELIDIVCQKGLQGLEVERSDFRLRIDGRAAPRVPVGQELVPSADAGASEANPMESAENEAGAVETGLLQATGDGVHTITSPIVGTFYASPSPEADPYVQIGDEVKKGQVLCIVEAMKLMNEIESDSDGTIIQIIGRDAQPVEFGEPLFVIQPA
ncbi:MAG: acetyl-CoA carboxylase biotin carboxyl carrier protein [Acidobacteriota bacterium]|nr:acetyl-CoA carboxylase biotin carboxyl carrier protein [Acidobacteriota bacterium]